MERGRAVSSRFAQRSPTLKLGRRTPDATWADQDLAEACLEGNEGAWSALVDKYKNLVYSIPLRYRIPTQDAADVFQAVWVDLYQELPRLRHTGALRSWLATVASNKCLHWKRAQQRISGQDVADLEMGEEPNFLAAREESERGQMLREGLSGLPERCREIIKLLFFSQPPRSYGEIAKGMGLAEGSIGFIRGRCLKKLRDQLEGMGF